MIDHPNPKVEVVLQVTSNVVRRRTVLLAQVYFYDKVITPVASTVLSSYACILAFAPEPILPSKNYNPIDTMSQVYPIKAQ
jgi:hypothetical protein